MRSKLRGRRDANQSLLVEQFKQNFCSVADLADLGNDIPDLLVSYGGFTCLVEVKTAKGELSDGQERFRRDWRGAVMVARTTDDVDEICDWMRKQARKLG